MNDFQSMQSGAAELKDAYPQALANSLKKKREALYQSEGMGETESDQKKVERAQAKGLLGR